MKRFIAVALTMSWYGWALSASAPSTAQEQAVPGLEVSFSVHCCTAPPDASSRISEVITVPVTDQVELPTLGSGLVPASIDISTTAIDIVFPESSLAATAAFNGYRFDFTGDAWPGISDATLAPETTAPLANAMVSTDGDSVFINVSGLRSSPGMRISVLLGTLPGQLDKSAAAAAESPARPGQGQSVTTPQFLVSGCEPQTPNRIVVVRVPDSVDLADDSAAHQLLNEGAELAQERCPTQGGFHDIEVRLFQQQTPGVTPTGIYTLITFARSSCPDGSCARPYWGNTYRNQASAARQRAVAESAKAAADARARDEWSAAENTASPVVCNATDSVAEAPRSSTARSIATMDRQNALEVIQSNAPPPAPVVGYVSGTVAVEIRQTIVSVPRSRERSIRALRANQLLVSAGLLNVSRVRQRGRIIYSYTCRSTRDCSGSRGGRITLILGERYYSQVTGIQAGDSRARVDVAIASTESRLMGCLRAIDAEWRRRNGQPAPGLGSLDSRFRAGPHDTSFYFDKYDDGWRLSSRF